MFFKNQESRRTDSKALERRPYIIFIACRLLTGWLVVRLTGNHTTTTLSRPCAPRPSGQCRPPTRPQRTRVGIRPRRRPDSSDDVDAQAWTDALAGHRCSAVSASPPRVSSRGNRSKKGPELASTFSDLRHIYLRRLLPDRREVSPGGCFHVSRDRG